MQDIEITTTDVAKALNKLNTFISWSPDNRLAYFLKQVWFYVDAYNEYFFNLALHQGVIPNKWKRAIISPIYKKGSHDKLINYRILSLTSVMCPILESIVTEKKVDINRHSTSIVDIVLVQR